MATERPAWLHSIATYLHERKKTRKQTRTQHESMRISRAALIPSTSHMAIHPPFSQSDCLGPSFCFCGWSCVLTLRWQEKHKNTFIFSSARHKGNKKINPHLFCSHIPTRSLTIPTRSLTFLSKSWPWTRWPLSHTSSATTFTAHNIKRKKNNDKKNIYTELNRYLATWLHIYILQNLMLHSSASTRILACCSALNTCFSKPSICRPRDAPPLPFPAPPWPSLRG